MDLEQRVRGEHPDWTDEQVAAEVTRLKVADPPRPDPPRPDPTPAPDDRDAAFARMRREKEDADRRAREAEDKLAAAARKKAEEEGRWKELAEQERARADKLEADQHAAEARRNAERTAGDLRYRDTGYALYLLAQEKVDLADAVKVKETLDRIAKERTDLVEGTAPPPSGGPAGGNGGDPPKVTAEQLRGMTPAQVRALDPRVVNEALAAA
jgi:hypothetical protein